MAQASAPRNRWLVFGAAFVITFFIAAIAVFSVFRNPLVDEHGWDATDVSVAMSIYLLFLAISGIGSGRIADRYGATRLMYAGGALFGLGWFLTGYATSIPMLYLTLGVIAGAGCGIVYNPAIATTLRWFPDIRGKVSGLLLASAAIGPAILAPVANWLIESHGVGVALRILGLVFAVFIFACGWAVSSPPEGFRPAGWTPPDVTVTSSTPRDLTWSKMIATPVFWMMIIMFAAAATSGNMLVSSVSAISQVQVGAVGAMDAAAFGAVVVSVSTLANFVGRLSFGALYDILGGISSLILSLGLTIVAMTAMIWASQVAVFVVCVAVLGFAFGGVLVLFPPLTSQRFGMTNIGINYGIMFLGYALGGFIGPRLGATYISTTAVEPAAYVGAIVIALVGVGLAIAVAAMDRKKAPAPVTA